jgi:fatty acid desaturase 2 (delta-6 desaturase)
MAKIVPAYLFYNWVASSYIFTNFAVSHTHLPVNGKDEKVDWVRYSSDYTMNCDDSFLCNWWMSYLNFQVGRISYSCLFHHGYSPRLRHCFCAD